MESLDRIRGNATPYPADLLEGCKTGLCLFGAGFLGVNDCIHMLDAGIRATVVDTDAKRLAEMWALYPDDWTFINSDAWKYAHEYEVAMAADLAGPFDVVSVDNWTGDIELRVLLDLDLWASLATKLLTVTAGPNTRSAFIPGWRSSKMRRSSHGVQWLVFRR